MRSSTKKIDSDKTVINVISYKRKKKEMKRKRGL